MIRSNALFVAVILSFVIGLFCSFLFMSAHLTRLKVQKDQTLSRIEANLRSGIKLLLSREDCIGFGQERQLDLFGAQKDSVYLKRIHWGVFDVGIVKANYRKLNCEKNFLYGYQPDSVSNAALYLSDQGYPVSVAGKVVIKGDCFLPKAGVRRGYIEGQTFEGETLVNGKLKSSQTALPEVNKEILMRLGYLLKDSIDYIKREGYEMETSIKVDTLLRTFSEAALMIRSDKDLELSDIYCKGNIVIYSSRSIIVRASAQLDYVQLFAPYIKIEQNFRGKIQAFASDSLLTGKNCTFDFPSVIGLVSFEKQKEKQKKKQLRISESNRLTGMVFTYTGEEKEKNQLLLYVGKHTVLEGQVYASGYTELDNESAILGNLTTHKLVVQRSNTTFDNWLYNTMLDSKSRTSYYVGSELLASTKNRRIIAWLP